MDKKYDEVEGEGELPPQGAPRHDQGSGGVEEHHEKGGPGKGGAGGVGVIVGSAEDEGASYSEYEEDTVVEVEVAEPEEDEGAEEGGEEHAG